MASRLYNQKTAAQKSREALALEQLEANRTRTPPRSMHFGMERSLSPAPQSAPSSATHTPSRSRAGTPLRSAAPSRGQTPPPEMSSVRVPSPLPFVPSRALRSPNHTHSAGASNKNESNRSVSRSKAPPSRRPLSASSVPHNVAVVVSSSSKKKPTVAADLKRSKLRPVAPMPSAGELSKSDCDHTPDDENQQASLSSFSPVSLRRPPQPPLPSLLRSSFSSSSAFGDHDAELRPSYLSVAVSSISDASSMEDHSQLPHSFTNPFRRSMELSAAFMTSAAASPIGRLLSVSPRGTGDNRSLQEHDARQAEVATSPVFTPPTYSRTPQTLSSQEADQRQERLVQMQEEAPRLVMTMEEGLYVPQQEIIARDDADEEYIEAEQQEEDEEAEEFSLGQPTEMLLQSTNGSLTRLSISPSQQRRNKSSSSASASLRVEESDANVPSPTSPVEAELPPNATVTVPQLPHHPQEDVLDDSADEPQQQEDEQTNETVTRPTAEEADEPTPQRESRRVTLRECLTPWSPEMNEVVVLDDGSRSASPSLDRQERTAEQSPTSREEEARRVLAHEGNTTITEPLNDGEEEEEVGGGASSCCDLSDVEVRWMDRMRSSHRRSTMQLPSAENQHENMPATDGDEGSSFSLNGGSFMNNDHAMSASSSSSLVDHHSRKATALPSSPSAVAASSIPAAPTVAAPSSSQAAPTAVEARSLPLADEGFETDEFRVSSATTARLSWEAPQSPSTAELHQCSTFVVDKELSFSSALSMMRRSSPTMDRSAANAMSSGPNSTLASDMGEKQVVLQQEQAARYLGISVNDAERLREWLRVHSLSQLWQPVATADVPSLQPTLPQQEGTGQSTRSPSPTMLHSRKRPRAVNGDDDTEETGRSCRRTPNGSPVLVDSMSSPQEFPGIVPRPAPKFMVEFPSQKQLSTPHGTNNAISSSSFVPPASSGAAAAAAGLAVDRFLVEEDQAHASFGERVALQQRWFDANYQVWEQQQQRAVTKKRGSLPKGQ